MRALVYLLFFLSGVTGLLYQVVWIRFASTVLGNTTYAVGTVVGVFMGGMALGAWLGGRQADRRTGARLLRLYGLLEAGVAVSALVVPWLISASDPLFRMLWGISSSIGPFYGVARVLLMGLVLVVPTTLMGATLPILVRYFSVSVDTTAGTAGRAYAVNTFGGVLGTLAAGFVLIPNLGLQTTTLLAVAGNLLIGGVAVLMARGGGGEVLPAPSKGPPPERVALIVAGLSGVAALAYEVAWTRALVLAMGSTVYSFTLILAVFILGLAAGGAVGGRYVGRIARPQAWLAWVQAGIGTAAILLLPVLADLPLTFARIVESFRRDYASLLFAQSALIAAFVFPPTFLMGAVFPLACRLAAPSSGGEGRAVAAVYTANTLGSILGTLLATFVLVPSGGLATTIRLAAGVNLAAGGMLLWRSGSRGPLLAAILAVIFVASWAIPAWNPSVMASGAYLYGSGNLRKARNQKVDLASFLENSAAIVDEQWDAYGLVTITKRGPSTVMRINGKVDASTNPADMRTQTYVSHLPLLHHPSPKRVMVVGLGAGFSLGTAARYKDVESIDCVEISPAVLRAASHFREATGDCLKDPRVRMAVGDGRQAIRFAREPWDVIICEPSNLWLSGMANLFTRDFFVEARERLAPGGVFCQWIHSYRLGSDDFIGIIRTFFDVFEGGSVWELLPGGDYVLMGSRTPARHSWGDLRRRLDAVLPASSELRDPKHEPALALIGHLVGDADAARRAAGKGYLLTDDLCRVEFTAPRMLYEEHREKILSWLDGVRSEPAELRLYPDLSGEERAQAARRREGRRAMARAVALNTRPPHPESGPGRYDPRGPESMEAMHRAALEFGTDVPTGDQLEGRGYELIAEAQESLRAGHPDLALRYLRAVPEGREATLEARMLQGRLLKEAKDLQGMSEAYEAAARADPRSYPAQFEFALAASLQDRNEEAVEAWKRASSIRPAEAIPMLGQAQGLLKLKRRDEARAVLTRLLEMHPQQPGALLLQKELENP